MPTSAEALRLALDESMRLDPPPQFNESTADENTDSPIPLSASPGLAAPVSEPS